MADSAKQYLAIDDKGKGHLPVRRSADGPADHGLMGGAWAALHSGTRGNKYEGPGKAEAIAKLKALYKSEGMDLPSEKSSEVTNLVSKRLPVTLGDPVGTTERNDATRPLYEIAIAVTGTWTKQDREFCITADDLKAMVANFEKRKNSQVVIDYEHASEMPEVARGGPVPAAGWIHALSANGVLKAKVEWTPDAEDMIKRGQYRFFSPAIDWSATDKETGESQGATLTSGALTNHPFLEELPAICLTDRDVTMRPGRDPALGAQDDKVGLQEMAGVHQDGLTQAISIAPGGANSQGGSMARKLQFKQATGKPGRLVPYDDTGDFDEVGMDDLTSVCDDATFAGIAAKRGFKKMDDDALSELMTEAGVDSTEEVKSMLRPAKLLGIERLKQAARSAVLSECLKEGAIDMDAAAKLADDKRLDFADYRRLEKAHELVQTAIRDGKFLPVDKPFISRLALSEPDNFQKWVRSKPRLRLTEMEGATPAAEKGAPGEMLSSKVRELREKNPKLTDTQALTEIGKSEDGRELIAAWRKSRKGADATS